MKPPRVVFDTNVLVSALLFPSGRVSWLRGAWQSGTVLPLVSRRTASELIRVLAYPKFGLTHREREDLLADYLPHCETIIAEGSPALPECRDPHDVPFLELALSGRAHALVTGDSGLLELATGLAVPILTPEAFREELAARG